MKNFGLLINTCPKSLPELPFYFKGPENSWLEGAFLKYSMVLIPKKLFKKIKNN
jgi:hypothetical protein